LLPLEKHIVASSHTPKDIIDSIAVYNSEVHTLSQVWPSENLKKLLLNLLIS
jgi:hypothetical protein